MTIASSPSASIWVPDNTVQSDYEDEQLYIEDQTKCGRVHEDQHRIRHPYWFKMTYFYPSNVGDIPNNVRFCYSLNV